MPARAAQLVDGAQRRLAEHRAARVVRRDRDDGARARRDRPLDRVEVELIVLVGRHADDAAAGHLDRHLVIEVERHRQDDLVARRGDRQHGVHERHVGAGGHHDPAAARDVDAVLGRQLARDRLDQRAEARRRRCIRASAAVASAVARPPRPPPAAGRSARPPGRARSCPGVSRIQRADDRDDRRLDPVHPGRARRHVSSACCLGPNGWPILAHDRAPRPAGSAASLAALRRRPRSSRVGRPRRGRHAAIAGTVYRVQGRRRQQAGALGHDRRVHEAGGRRTPTASATASSAGPTTDNPLIALEIASPETLKNLDRYKQLERQAVLPERRADGARTRRDLPPGQGRRADHLQRRTRPRSARRRWRSSWCTSSPPTTRRRRRRFSTTSSCCWCRA